MTLNGETIVKIIRMLLAVVALALASGPSGAATINGSGNTKTESRNAVGFHAIALGVSANLTIRQGNAEGVAITGDDNIVALVETVVEDGVLKIRWPRRGDYTTSYKNLAIAVDAKTLDSIAIGGSGTIRAEKLSAPSLAAKIGGSGEIAIDRLEVKSANVTIGGSGRITVAGRTDKLETTVAGTGDVMAGKLEARDVHATLQGTGHATVWATANLQVTIAGAGEVDYYGRPQVRQTLAGSGRVRQLGDAP